MTSESGAILMLDKDYPLHMACASGNQELVDWILVTPAGQKQLHKVPHCQDDFVWNRALDHDHHALALKLVQSNVDFITKDSIAFWNVFQVALECESMELIDWLWPYAEKQEV